MQLNKIGFVPFGSLSYTPSSRIRIKYIVKYLNNFKIDTNPMNLYDCDVIFFQKRYKKIDVDAAKMYKNLGKIIIFDLTDPVWDKKYPAVFFPITNDSEEYFRKMIDIADCMLFCTENLMSMFKDKFMHPYMKVWKDRIDLDIHPFSKIHLKKDKYKILWFGTRFNVPSIELAREDLEKIGKVYNIDFVCMYDIVQPGSLGYFKIKPFKNVNLILKSWDEKSVIKEISDSDITINPHIGGKSSYKSNNKTVKSMALGVPCVEDNFYNEIKKLLDDTDYRMSKAIEDRKIVEKYYDVKISVRELNEIIFDLKKERSK